MPILIMTPNISYIHEDPGSRSLHCNPAWNPFSFKQVEFWLTEDECREMPYAAFRQKQIEDELNVGDSKERGRSQAWTDLPPPVE